MEAVASAVEGLALTEWLRFSRWGYATVNAVHVFGIALLVGAIVPLDLRLLGFWSSIELDPLYRILSRVAATGLAVAIASGLLLFAVRASEYAALDLFLTKITLVGAGAIFAVTVHLAVDLPRLALARRHLVGAISLLLWPTVLVCGRLLAFVEA